ncbi:MATE family efflux transporter [Paenibacillus allorhizosphaerae]|uniref:FMN/FAD exporter YeeO n=1 Tax=Paenibacillus allorhizosphaerae TaxID=2849866 RepID=A0ABM8VFK2_9BACL|nr:MATE family efflux transporter [Paenibacillus allorhizosphaerae]CAG7635277.1 putative FMN/FAD exporter YeeO [Paenibacillus allorhizosphaerae]
MQSEKKLTLWALAWPIFIEMFLQFLLGTADTLMVSHISDDAVAVVGISNQLFQAATILFMTVAAGAGVLIAQNLGAGKREEARIAAIIAVKVSLYISAGLSVLLFVFAEFVAKLLQIPDPLLPLAQSYISIVGGGTIFTAAMAALGSVIRNTGNTRGPMFIAIGMNVVHVLLGYVFIYGAFGFPQLGLTGAAVSTLVSRLAASIVLLRLFLYAFERKVEWRDFQLFDRSLFKDILRLGWPMGVNSASWFVTQLVIFSFVAMLGAKELAARTYMNTMESFCFLLGYSVAMAAQIQIAYLFGAGDNKEAYRSAFRALGLGLLIVIPGTLLLYAAGGNVLHLFTADAEIVALGVSLLAVNIILQPGKMLNMAINGALTAVGDTRFIMINGLLSMWLIATGLSYLFGIRLEWGLIGIYIGMIIDEYTRGVIVLIRWIKRAQLTRRKRVASESSDMSASQ